MKFQKNLGLLILAIWLIITGIHGLDIISLGRLAILMPILAIVAGVLILINR